MPYKGSAKRILRLTEEDVNDHFVRDTNAKIKKIADEFRRIKGKEPETRRILEEIIKEKENLREYFVRWRAERERILNS